LRIGIDGTCWGNRRGYGRFLRELLPALGAASSDHTYSVYLDRAACSIFDLGHPFYPRPVATSTGIGDAATDNGNRSLLDILRMTLAVREPLDLFFFPTVYSFFPVLRRMPVIVGIHDTIADRSPQFSFSSRKADLFWRAKVRLAIAQARTIVTVSEYSRRAIAEWFRIPADQIRVIQEAASPRFARCDFPAPSRPFALYVGGISPNKNLARLIRAFCRTSARAAGARLVLVGDYSSDGFKGNYSELRTLVGELGVEADVEFTGFIPDEDLTRLYNTCTVFVMPSLDEGFGLPAIEAMACGRPVVVSRGNSLEEITAGAGLTVDPLDVEQLGAAIDRVFEFPELRKALGEGAVIRAAQFSWDTAARQLLKIFEATQPRRIP
jgi:glycosyltransferase involved in cell wall biosynthesis